MPPTISSPACSQKTRTEIIEEGDGKRIAHRDFRGSRFYGVLVLIEAACPRRVRLEVADKAAGTESPLL